MGSKENSISSEQIELLNKVLAASTDHIYISDRQQRYLYASPAALAALGLQQEQILGKTWQELGFPADVMEVYDAQRQWVLQTGNSLRSEMNFPTVNGIRYYEYVVAPIWGNDGEIEGIVNTGRDSTERKQAEEALHLLNEELEARVAARTQELTDINESLRLEIAQRQQAQAALKESQIQLQCQLAEIETIYQSAPIGLAVLDTDLRFVRINERLAQMNGFSVEAHIGRTVQELLPNLGDTAEQLLCHILATGIPVLNIEISGETPAQPGVQRTWLESFLPLFDGERIIGISAVCEEITERKQAEIALRESEQRLQLALLAGNAGTWDWKIPTNEITWSESLFTLFGITRDTFDGKYESFLNLVYPEDRESVANLVQQAINSQIPQFWIEFRVVKADGAVRWLESIGRVFYYETGQPLRMMGIDMDITERKQAQEKICEQAALIDVSTDAIFVCDLKNQILFWNQGAENLYGWTAEERLGKIADEIFSREALSQFELGITATIEHGCWQGELEQITKAGRKIIVNSRWTLLRNLFGNTQSILVVNTDITEKKQLEQQFYRAQRLESVGTLASGIAHDLNNVFAPIMMIAQLLPSKCKSVDAQTQEMFHTLEISCQRGANLVKQILTFARGTEGQRILLQPENLLQGLVKVIKQTFPKSIEIIANFHQNPLWMVQADPTQLEQVFMNLVVNARDAMPDGGQLIITAENRTINENSARSYLEAKAGEYIVVSVADTGTGIPPEFLDLIFDPFFTTKEVGKGSGLGLSTVLGIVKNHGGFVQVSTQIGQGTQFQVFLPRTEGIPAKVITELQLSRSNGELILVVDDEAAFRQTTQTTLADHNYKILVAKDGVEAIALYIEHQSEISAVLLDMFMPNVDGLTAIYILRNLNPNVKIIAMSGLPANQQKALSSGADKFLSKPYTVIDLLTALSEVIENTHD